MKQLIADRALLPEGWRNNVLLEWDDKGILTRVSPDAEKIALAPRVAGTVLPGIANLHSHAFQRAMAGLTEYRSDPNDSFWSWRTLMYKFAGKLAPADLKAIAVQLYIEMLQAGYTSVCEFHYLHHDSDGKPYANPAENMVCLIEAAQEAGIGLTLLPVMYQYSGFGGQAPHAGQARFINSPEWIMHVLQMLQAAHPQHAGLRYGVAPHSLRAVTPQSLQELLTHLRQWDAQAPVHIHIAEQNKEVEDCVAALGARPVAWLLDNVEVDRHWCLVHATQMTTVETEKLAHSGAVAGICPTTEANLGDGIFNGVAYAGAQGVWGIGSDSHVSTSVSEELRLYEYSQRLQHRQRNMLVGSEGTSVGGYLYRQALRGGAAASGRPVAGLQLGQRADLLVLDQQHADLNGKHGEQLLDSFVFCQHGQTPLRDVMVGGHWVIRDHKHTLQEQSALSYANTMKKLLDY
ncbi:formimidoylglutamate deiminase [Collimonas sp.]|jgi:formimidoylglutamate deiminase|uniref:formimidoylglutamate deiminase n=1 Tax=Collimonas sp. TaxID=1963772 RepID=UPI002B5DD0B9|nr:formimidoylglutamate deiminase [Collimonas sp.]HWW05143.1 formimidoylglutamate deiminase [Collimonas sp.]